MQNEHKLGYGRFEDPEPTSAHIASMIRADITTSHMDFGPTPKRMSPRLRHDLPTCPAISDFVNKPRNLGFAFAFDLPSPTPDGDSVNALARRVVFGAGTQTVRYRLSHAFESSIRYTF